MGNTKNPTALLMQRMAAAGKGAGSMATLMQKYFADNYGKTDLPKRVADFVIYDQVAVGATATAAFFQGTPSTTRTNFPGGSFIMPASEHAIITGIRFCQGNNAALTSTQWSYGVYSAAFLNGEVTVTSNGETVLTQLPMSSFMSNQNQNITAAVAPGAPSIAGVNNDDAGMFYLIEPIVLLGQTDIKTTVTLKSNASANDNLRIELHGIRFIGG
jgi:hypothetical protein